MPHVKVKMYPAESEEQKIKLAEEITKAIVLITGKPEAAVSVAIEEIAETSWIEQVYDKDIVPQMEKLYKKPGY